MKKTTLSILWILIALVALFSLSACTPQRFLTTNGVIFGQDYRLSKGNSIDGDLHIFGGNSLIAEDAKVEGSVFLYGGSLSIEGEVEGDVIASGGYISLGEKAKVDGSVHSLGTLVNRSDKAVVKGSITSDPSVRMPSLATLKLPSPFRAEWEVITGGLWAVFRAIAYGLLALLLAVLAPRPVERLGLSVTAQPVTAGVMGLLTLIVVPALLVVLTLTLILIPVTLLGALVFALAFPFGWIGLGLIVGRKLAVTFKMTWTDPLCAGIGTLVLALASSIANLIPCIGWTIPALIAMLGLGGVVLTRFGTQYNPPLGGPTSGGVSVSPVAPVAPVPPAAEATYQAPAPVVESVEPTPGESQPPATFTNDADALNKLFAEDAAEYEGDDEAKELDLDHLGDGFRPDPTPDEPANAGPAPEDQTK